MVVLSADQFLQLVEALAVLAFFGPLLALMAYDVVRGMSSAFADSLAVRRAIRKLAERAHG